MPLIAAVEPYYLLRIYSASIKPGAKLLPIPLLFVSLFILSKLSASCKLTPLQKRQDESYQAESSVATVENCESLLKNRVYAVFMRLSEGP
jgi:hypothetical protein